MRCPVKNHSSEEHLLISTSKIFQTHLVFLLMLPNFFGFSFASFNICFTIKPPIECATQIIGLKPLNYKQFIEIKPFYLLPTPASKFFSKICRLLYSIVRFSGSNGQTDLQSLRLVSYSTLRIRQSSRSRDNQDCKDQEENIFLREIEHSLPANNRCDQTQYCLSGATCGTLHPAYRAQR